MNIYTVEHVSPFKNSIYIFGSKEKAIKYILNIPEIEKDEYDDNTWNCFSKDIRTFGTFYLKEAPLCQ